MTCFRTIKTIVACAAAPVAAASFCDPQPGWTTFWADEFDGDTLDMGSWNVLEGGGLPPALWGCRAAYCSADNVIVANGTLTLVSKRESIDGFNYSSAAVTTKGKKSWSFSPRYRTCISAILPGAGPVGSGSGAGLWPAHWLMPDDDSCDPDEGEFDILEMVDGDGTAYATYHWQDDWPARTCSYPVGHQERYAKVAMPSDWGTAFHEYAVEHGPTYVAFVYDGQTVLNVSSSDQGPNPPLFWPMPFYLFLNTAVGAVDNWPGAPNASTVFPTNHTIDYVRVLVNSG